MRYYGSSGKPITRDQALASLPTGSKVRVEVSTHHLDIQLLDGEYQSGCEKCNAKCRMTKPESGLRWAEEHLRRWHS